MSIENQKYFYKNWYSFVTYFTNVDIIGFIVLIAYMEKLPLS